MKLKTIVNSIIRNENKIESAKGDVRLFVRAALNNQDQPEFKELIKTTQGFYDAMDRKAKNDAFKAYEIIRVSAQQTKDDTGFTLSSKGGVISAVAVTVKDEADKIVKQVNDSVESKQAEAPESDKVTGGSVEQGLNNLIGIYGLDNVVAQLMKSEQARDAIYNQLIKLESDKASAAVHTH